MKKTEIDGISLFTLLNRSSSALVRLLRKETLRNYLASEGWIKYISELSNYGSMLNDKLKPALIRATLLDNCCLFFSLINLPLLPPHCVDAVLMLLSNDELIALYKSCKMQDI